MARDMRPVPLEEVEATLSPERRARVAELAAQIRAEQMSLAELRKARSMTQTTLARKMGKTQTFISQIESRNDLYISTLRDALKGMGADLTIMALFPDRKPVAITGFSDLDSLEPLAPLEGMRAGAAKIAPAKAKSGLKFKVAPRSKASSPRGTFRLRKQHQRHAGKVAAKAR